jgi:hypothetical protein
VRQPDALVASVLVEGRFRFDLPGEGFIPDSFLVFVSAESDCASRDGLGGGRLHVLDGQTELIMESDTRGVQKHVHFVFGGPELAGRHKRVE